MVKKTDIVVFTLHKSASMFIHQVCEYLSQQCSIAHFSPNSRVAPIDERLLLTDKQFWRTNHGCFAPIRFYVDVPDIDNYKVILHLRDPRDVLVSMFYSYCYIHNGPVTKNTGYRREAAEEGIDAFVLAKAMEDRSSSYVGGYGTGGPVQDLTGGLLLKYRDLIENLLGRKNVIFVKYEEMVMDFQRWLEKFTDPFPLPDRQGTIDYLVSLSPKFFPKRTEDVMVHTRRITPGDHKNKLKKSTISELDTIFGDILEALGYESG
jgi:hypothetical protein